LVAVIALIFFTGCSWTATIGRTDELDNEAEIDHSDADTLYLLARNGQVHRVPRHSVRSIDHPGNVEMIIGAILVGLGAMIAIDQRDENRTDGAIIGAVYGVPGLTLLLTGMIRYIPSLRAAWAFQTADESTGPLPLPAAYPPPRAIYPPPPAAAPPATPAPPPPAPPAPPQPEDEQPQVTPGAT
jgi:hypothetical protein